MMDRHLLRIHLDRKAGTQGETDIIHSLGDFGTVIVDGALDLVVLVGLADYGVGVLKQLFRTLVHREAGLLEPAFGFEVLGEIRQEGEEIVLIFLGTRLHSLCDREIGRAVEIFESQVPGQDGVAIDLRGYSATHHELYPLVEDGIIIHPGTVGSLELSDHPRSACSMGTGICWR